MRALLLAEVRIADVQPGDIVLRKYLHDDHPVAIGQKLFMAERGSKYTTHAMLSLGFGVVAHLDVVNTHLKLGMSRLVDLGINAIVYRPVDQEQGKSAVAVAKWMLSKGVNYSTSHALSSALHGASFDRGARARAEQVAHMQLPTSAMMCSEFVTFAYQGVEGRPYIELDAMRTPPLRLEDFLNAHPERFRFVGAVRVQGNETAGGIFESVKSARAVH